MIKYRPEIDGLRAISVIAVIIYHCSLIVNKNLFLNEADEVVFKLFSDILSEVSQSYYPPRSKKVINLISKVKNNTHHKATLGGCVIECKSNYILISKEPMATKISNQLKK